MCKSRIDFPGHIKQYLARIVGLRPSRAGGLALGLLLALPAAGAAGNPPDTVPVDAAPADVTGVLTVLVADDFQHGNSQALYALEDKASHRKFDIRFQGAIPNGLQSGATVRIHGLAKGKDLYLEANGTTTTYQVLAPGVTVVSGDQKTLVIVADFADVPVACSASAVEDLMFSDPSGNSIDALYRETSFGQVSFSGIVAGPYPIDARSTDPCNPGAWADAANAAAAAQGIDLNAYPRKVYVLPSSAYTVCGYTGLGQVGGSPSRAWTFECDMADSYGHELGHNLGMGHASTPTNEYGDTSDVMGAGGWGLRQVNSAHKEQMGWLLAPAEVLGITQSGTYTIAPLELDPSQATAPQALKIAKPDTGDYYYLSYRLPDGFDANLAYSYLRRLTIHHYAGDGSASRTYLLQSLADGGQLQRFGEWYFIHPAEPRRQPGHRAGPARTRDLPDRRAKPRPLAQQSGWGTGRKPQLFGVDHQHGLGRLPSQHLQPRRCASGGLDGQRFSVQSHPGPGCPGVGDPFRQLPRHRRGGNLRADGERV